MLKFWENLAKFWISQNWLNKLQSLLCMIIEDNSCFFFSPIFWFSEHLKKDLVINGKTCLKTFFFNTRKMLYKLKSESKCEAKVFQIFFSKFSEFFLQKKKWNMQQNIFLFFNSIKL
jgi:hypothetical protein